MNLYVYMSIHMYIYALMHISMQARSMTCMGVFMDICM